VSRIVPVLSEEQLRRLPSSAESMVYKRCRDSLGQSTLAIFSLPWIRVSPHGTPRDGETDFILFDERWGILVIEVKGGGVQIDGASGTCLYCLFGQPHELIAQRWQVQLLGILQDRGLLHRLGGAH
jgi:hypothetical protein